MQNSLQNPKCSSYSSSTFRECNSDSTFRSTTTLKHLSSCLTHSSTLKIQLLSVSIKISQNPLTQSNKFHKIH
ncbi:hypothetical protein RchiOBHm_Chr2g0162851 [Rosa chinensis]|uniref:Uncharacterized protein n=1 Tax=Rosa chinensis TaxID=74649 RepID=A0A2P6S358_ROSCH|nr:hypothetical protein RchiOBHm_Chr2g0162851 [Rosa chinensis]